MGGVNLADEQPDLPQQLLLDRRLRGQQPATQANTYTPTHTHINIYIYIYIYKVTDRERERKRKKGEGERASEGCGLKYLYAKRKQLRRLETHQATPVDLGLLKKGCQAEMPARIQPRGDAGNRPRGEGVRTHDGRGVPLSVSVPGGGRVSYSIEKLIVIMD
jgi:hypothetical protein